MSDIFWSMGPIDLKFGITLFFGVLFHPWEYLKKNFFWLPDRFWNRLTIEPRDRFCYKNLLVYLEVSTNTCPNLRPVHPIARLLKFAKDVLLLRTKPVLTSELTDQLSPKKVMFIRYTWPTCGPNFRSLACSVLKKVVWVVMCAYGGYGDP